MYCQILDILAYASEQNILQKSQKKVVKNKKSISTRRMKRNNKKKYRAHTGLEPGICRTQSVFVP